MFYKIENKKIFFVV